MSKGRIACGIGIVCMSLVMAAGCGGGATIVGPSNALQSTGNVPSSPASGSGGATSGSSGGGQVVGGSSGGGQPATVDFATQIQPIFDRNCALSGCHASDTASGGQILDAER